MYNNLTFTLSGEINYFGKKIKKYIFLTKIIYFFWNMKLLTSPETSIQNILTLKSYLGYCNNSVIYFVLYLWIIWHHWHTSHYTFLLELRVTVVNLSITVLTCGNIWFRGTVVPHSRVCASVFFQCYFYVLLVSHIFWHHRQKEPPKRMLLRVKFTFCSKNKDRKSRTKCSVCKQFICAEHQNKVCPNCSK